MVNILVNIAPELYNPYVTTNKKGKKLLLVQCMNALYRSMVALLMFYKKLVSALKLYGFKHNLYNPCIANKIVKGKMLTICHHVDECKISQVSTPVVDETISLLKADFEIIFEDGSGAMQVHRGKTHAYVGMTLDYTYPGQVGLSMIKHVKYIIETFRQAKSKFNNGFIKVK